MTSATLYREGPDLDVLLAELDEEHGGNVHVVDVDYGRDGGVMGFFARRTVGVHFVVTDGAEPADVPVAAPFAEGPLEAMLRAAEAVESGRAPEVVDDSTDNVEFARMLLDIASRKAAERAAAVAEGPVQPGPSWSAPSVIPPVGGSPDVVAPAPIAPAPIAPAPIVAAADFAASRAELLEKVRVRPVGAHRAADEVFPAPAAAPAPLPTPAPAPVPFTGDLPVDWRPVARQSAEYSPVNEETVRAPEPEAAVVLPANPLRSPLTLRRQLSEIGVPLSWIPADSASAYSVIEQLVREVPLAAPTDLGPGQLLVVAGPATQAHAEAVRLAGRLRLDPSTIRTAGCGSEPIRHRRQAAALELEVRGTRTEPCIVVVATDSSADLGGAADLAWAAEIVAALAPDHLLLVVDATCRVTDARTTLAAFGTVTAIAIVSAARTASPAAMWELGVPVASLDGREATRGGWAALLIDRLTSLDGA